MLMFGKISFHESIGYFAAFLYSIMLLPQLFKTVKTKSTEDLSPHFLMIFLVAAICMTYYGIKIKSYLLS